MSKKRKTFWDSLSKDTRDLVAIFAILIAVLFLVFVMQNPVVGGLTILSLLIVGELFTGNSKPGIGGSKGTKRRQAADPMISPPSMLAIRRPDLLRRHNTI